MNDEDLLGERTKDLFRIWNRERNKEIFKIIDVLSDDCLAQYDCIEDEKDAPWDCHDKDNWDGMVEQLDKIKEILINGETHENKTQTETTREYGKEL